MKYRIVRHPIRNEWRYTAERTGWFGFWRSIYYSAEMGGPYYYYNEDSARAAIAEWQKTLENKSIGATVVLEVTAEDTDAPNG